jgi:hypothetical protein
MWNEQKKEQAKVAILAKPKVLKPLGFKVKSKHPANM